MTKAEEFQAPQPTNFEQLPYFFGEQQRPSLTGRIEFHSSGNVARVMVVETTLAVERLALLQYRTLRLKLFVCDYLLKM